MPSRRLLLVCSSDEEEEEEDYHPPTPPPPQQQQNEDIDDIIMDDIETDFQTVTLNSANPTPSSSNYSATTETHRHNSCHVEPIPLYISDEDQENININDHTNNSFSGSANGNFEVSQSPINVVLERIGVRVRKEWLDSCLQGLQSSVQGFQRMDDSAKAKLCFAQFLLSDMNLCGAAVLPPNVHTLHMIVLKGPFVLQVDEVVNISKPLRERYKNAAPPGIKRCLKLSMTDGVQRIFGMEYRPIKNLGVAPAGLKVVVCNVDVRHGLMMLVPESIEVLGGTVEVLEAARQRIVHEINKPARGRRTRTGEIPPLMTRATHAAWPRSNDAAPGHVDTTSSVNATPAQASGHGISSYSAALGNVDRTSSVNTTSMQASVQVRNPTNVVHEPDFVTPSRRTDAEASTSAATWPQEIAEVPLHTDMPTGVQRQGPREEFEVRVTGRNTEPITLSSVHPRDRVTTPQHFNEPTIGVVAPPEVTNEVNPSGIPDSIPDNKDNDISSMLVDVEEMSMLEELEHRFILSRDKEMPFSYLASLSAKFSSNNDETCVVRGKIKCFLTDVKIFKHKGVSSYELQVYVDDGSLISEILIDHKVVQNQIGYTPQEVASALASSDSKCVSQIKETMKKFQIFLVNFEGTMIVEMSKASDIPVAVEMKQGCPASDTWLLFNRVNTFSNHPQNQSHLNPIELSP